MFPLSGFIFIVALTGCLSQPNYRGVPGEPLTEDWYYARHKRVLKEFYGVQIRLEQIREEREEERQKIAAEWWAQEKIRRSRLRREAQKEALRRQVFEASLKGRFPSLPLSN